MKNKTVREWGQILRITENGVVLGAIRRVITLPSILNSPGISREIPRIGETQQVSENNSSTKVETKVENSFSSIHSVSSDTAVYVLWASGRATY